MMKKIGISLATLCAGVAFAIPQAAKAADRDDYNNYNNRPSYQYNYNEGRSYQDSYQAYGPQVRYRNDYRTNHRDTEWGEHVWQAHRRWSRNDHDRDDYNRYER